jgi:hypothetical protein
MNKLPPLPLVDGVFIFDNSSIEKFKCPRAWQYAELNLKSPVAERAGANFGYTIHRGLETRYKLVDNNKVDAVTQFAIDTSMAQWLSENPQPENDFRNLDHACKMSRVYNQIYGNEGFEIIKNHIGKPIIEASFALPFGRVMNTDIYYSGKIDLGIEDNNGLWSFDHKTAFQFGDTFSKQMAMDGGQLGYCWALSQVTGRKPQGYIIDAIRVRRPSVKASFTGEAPIDATDFTRTPYYVSDDMLAEWKEDVMAVVTNIFLCYDADLFPRHRWQCTNKYGACDFYDVCSTPRAQRYMILNSNLFEENVWTKGLKTASDNENKEK